MAENPVDKLTALQKRCDDIKQKKMSSKASLEALQQQYNEQVEAARALGIEDVSDIPATLQQMQQELDTLLAAVESQVTETEKQIQQLG